ncbi:DUF3606 domain-containing protein [Pseudomonas saponiphila]|uniref:DUF3606 domain-containing protein n=1 Tax=Pseudomonas saponiphila TaxID=556534 RepID=UPI003905A2A9
MLVLAFPLAQQAFSDAESLGDMAKRRAGKHLVYRLAFEGFGKTSSGLGHEHSLRWALSTLSQCPLSPGQTTANGKIELQGLEKPNPAPYDDSRHIATTQYHLEAIMSDNKHITHPEDAKRIDIHDANEVRNWTTALGCTEAELKQAVAAVGTYADKVRQYLGKS